jgi:hypothetical protein
MSRLAYCECGQCEDCSDAAIEIRQPDGTVRLIEKETREEWRKRTMEVDG